MIDKEIQNIIEWLSHLHSVANYTNGAIVLFIMLSGAVIIKLLVDLKYATKKTKHDSDGPATIDELKIRLAKLEKIVGSTIY